MQLFFFLSTDGQDYNGTSVLLTFDDTVTSNLVTIPILDNNIHELAERFFGNLSSIEPANVVMLNPGGTTVEIIDDEGKLVFKEDFNCSL